MNNWFFRYRFYWFYPLILLFAFSIFGMISLLIKTELPSLSKVLGGFIIAFSVGLIWGITERFRERKHLSNDSLCETVELLTDDLDTYNSGILIIHKNQKLTFKDKNNIIFELLLSEIKNVNIKKEYRIFPLMLTIKFNNGEEYNFESQFPFVWKNLLLS